MSEIQNQGFAKLVSEKYDEALATEGCIIQQAQRGKIIEQVCLIDPQSDRRHGIQRQGYTYPGYSHIVETTATGEIKTPLANYVSMVVNPQRLLVDPQGEVKLLSRREMLYMSEESIEETRESLERSKPYSVGAIATISAVNSLPGYEESLIELLVSNPGSLQERAQGLLRSGFVSRRYCQIKWINVDDEEFPTIPQSFAVVRAKFVSSEITVRGTLSNVVEMDRRGLAADSIEVSLEFDSPRLLSTADGEIFGDEYDLTVEGNEVYVATSTPSGLSNLTPEALVLVGEIIDSASLIPVRNK